MNLRFVKCVVLTIVLIIFRKINILFINKYTSYLNSSPLKLSYPMPSCASCILQVIIIQYFIILKLSLDNPTFVSLLINCILLLVELGVPRWHCHSKNAKQDVHRRHDDPLARRTSKSLSSHGRSSISDAVSCPSEQRIRVQLRDGCSRDTHLSFPRRWVDVDVIHKMKIMVLLH